MNIVAIETSVRIGSLAALRGEGSEAELIRSVELPSDRRTAQSLLPTLQSLLKECDWKPAEVQLVCVSSGPGSFTGLRLGITTAKTLAYATGAELVGVSTLATIAATGETNHGRFWSILDAQRQELFVASFEGDWQSKGNVPPETSILSVEAWLEQLQPGDRVAGPPLSKLVDRLPEGVKAVAPEFWKPQAATLGKLGYVAQQLGQTVDPMQLVPNYYRKSAAEEKAESGNSD